MSNRHADGYKGDVITVDGKCYQFLGFAPGSPDIAGDPDAFSDCKTCADFLSGAGNPQDGSLFPSDLPSALSSAAESDILSSASGELSCPDPNVCPTDACFTCGNVLVELNGFAVDLGCTPTGADLDNRCTNLNEPAHSWIVPKTGSCTWSTGLSALPSGVNLVTIECVPGGLWRVFLDIDLTFDAGCWVIAQYEGFLTACGDGTCPEGTAVLNYIPGSGLGADPCTGTYLAKLTPQ